MSGDPDVNLAEPLFPNLFAGYEERGSSAIGRIDAHAQELVAVASATVFPRARDSNRIFSNAAEPVGQLLSCLVELLRFNFSAVVIVQR